MISKDHFYNLTMGFGHGVGATAFLALATLVGAGILGHNTLAEMSFVVGTVAAPMIAYAGHISRSIKDCEHISFLWRQCLIGAVIGIAAMGALGVAGYAVIGSINKSFEKPVTDSDDMLCGKVSVRQEMGNTVITLPPMRPEC